LVTRSLASIERLDRLVSNLLDASRAREDRLAQRLQRIDLVEVVREAMEEQRQAHPRRILRLDSATQAPHKEPIIVEADPDRIGQVISSFVSNAVKFSPPETPIRVTVTADGADGAEARVAVYDEGIGIAEEEQERIWERFYQVEGAEPLKDSLVGLGLGLYISRDIIERHGGRIGVDSSPGSGATFWFTLPHTAQGRDADTGMSQGKRRGTRKRHGEGAL
jgi:signal transduction histidine kinase